MGGERRRGGRGGPRVGGGEEGCGLREEGKGKGRRVGRVTIPVCLAGAGIGAVRNQGGERQARLRLGTDPRSFTFHDTARSQLEHRRNERPLLTPTNPFLRKTRWQAQGPAAEEMQWMWTLPTVAGQEAHGQGQGDQWQGLGQGQEEEKE